MELGVKILVKLGKFGKMHFGRAGIMKNHDGERLGCVLTLIAVKYSRDCWGKCTNSLCKRRMKCRMCCWETKSLNIFQNRASQEKYS